MITIKTAKKQKLKESKGITLIALVITIIVLLILAGVTIATLTGNNGILGKANDAKTQTEQAKEDDRPGGFYADGGHDHASDHLLHACYVDEQTSDDGDKHAE